MSDFTPRERFTIVLAAILIVSTYIAAALLLLLLIVSNAWAGEVTVSWRYPTYMAATPSDTTTCCDEDSTRLENDLDHVRFRLVRFSPPDTIYPGTQSARGKEGQRDSVTFTIADSVHYGEALIDLLDGSGKPACTSGHKVWVNPPSIGPPSGLNAEYWSGAGSKSFRTLLLSRADSSVNFDWGAGSPGVGVPSDSFSTRWSGNLSVPTAGSWTFYIYSDDGVRIWLDGAVLYDYWGERSGETTIPARTLTAGLHSIRVEFFETRQVAYCRLSWAGPGVTKQPIPAARYSR